MEYKDYINFILNYILQDFSGIIRDNYNKIMEHRSLIINIEE